MRAAIWTMMNQPLGDDFRSWWGGNPEVTIELEDGVRITRVRTKSKNQYFLDDPKKKGEPLKFDAVGKGGVPEEIMKALNIDSDISIRDQSSRHFLLAETPSERARILNKTVKLDIIDVAMSRINSMQHETREALKGKQGELEKVVLDLDQLKGLDALDGKVAGAESLEQKFREARNEVKKLEALLGDLEQAREKLDKVRPVATLKPRVDGLLRRQGELEAMGERAEGLRALVSRLRKTQEGLAKARPVSALKDRLKTLEAKSGDLAKVKKQIDSLKKYIKSAENARASKGDALERQHKLEAQFEDLMPDQCPLCRRSCSCLTSS
jgi:DNA repair exonuclease SbcCD ATPase subunit